MELIEIFQVLGIEQTKEESIIKDAYRKKLAVTNPEDHPEGFKRLRSAYEQACQYAKSTQEDQEGEEEQRDMTPSGLWVEKAARLYNNIISRQDVEKWRELFEEDVFLSLEDEENCRLKLLRFLMDHFKLPTQVWQLFNEKLSLVKDAAKLRERFPADFIRYVVSKCERGEDVVFEQFQGEEEAPYDLFLQYYDRCWQAIQDEDLDQAAEYIKNADELKIFHPVMEICRANLLVKQGNVQEAVERLEELRQRFPEDAMICYNAAEVMWKHDRKEKAAGIYEQLRAENENHYMSNVRLSEWYYEQGNFKQAKKCAETVLSSGADDVFMELLSKINSEIEKELEKEYECYGTDHWEAGLELGWCYLQDGKVSAGIRIADELENKIPAERETERKGLLTKLLVEEAEYDRAIELSRVWQEALEQRVTGDEDEEEKERDRDRIRQAHLIRMQSYRNLGYCDREKLPLAIKEAESIETGTSKDVGLLLEKAQIYMEMEEYEKSLDLVRRLVEDYQIYAAYATSLEVYRRQWNASGVIQASRQCISFFPGYVRAYEQAAKVYLDLKHTEDLKQLLEEAAKNQVKSVILDAYRYQMDKQDVLPESKVLDEKLDAFRKKYASRVADGDIAAYEEGLQLLTTYLYWFPGTYMLVERGIFHRAAHRYQEAKEDFEKALAENPAQPYALNGLSFVYKYLGNYEKALFCIKKAILYMDKEMSPVIYADMGNLYSLLGDNQKALAAYQKYAQLTEHKSSYQMEKLAQCYARAGGIQKAVEILKKIYDQERDAFILNEKLASLYQAAGLEKDAERILKQWEKALNRKKSWLKFYSKTEPEEKEAQKQTDFYNKRAWQELLFGDRADAMKWFEKYTAAAEKTDKIVGALCDAAFAAILCGDDKRGKKYTEKLQKWLVKEEQSGDKTYYNRQRGHLQIVFLAAYYSKTPETLEDILKKEGETEKCRFCTYHICKEMEAVRILYLLRIGKKEEAMERLRRNLEKQPQDEYMIAIRHMKG